MGLSDGSKNGQLTNDSEKICRFLHSQKSMQCRTNKNFMLSSKRLKSVPWAITCCLKRSFTVACNLGNGGKDILSLMFIFCAFELHVFLHRAHWNSEIELAARLSSSEAKHAPISKPNSSSWTDFLTALQFTAHPINDLHQDGVFQTGRKRISSF